MTWQDEQIVLPDKLESGDLNVLASPSTGLSNDQLS